ncbi:rCG46101, partial [Rattus norvegicus]
PWERVKAHRLRTADLETAKKLQN